MKMKAIFFFWIVGILLIGSVFAFSIKEDWVKLNTIDVSGICSASTSTAITSICKVLEKKGIDVSTSDLVFEKNSDGVIKVYDG